MASMPHFSSSWPSQLCTGPRDCSRDISDGEREPSNDTLSGGAAPDESPLTGRMGLKSLM